MRSCLHGQGISLIDSNLFFLGLVFLTYTAFLDVMLSFGTMCIVTALNWHILGTKKALCSSSARYHTIESVHESFWKPLHYITEDRIVSSTSTVTDTCESSHIHMLMHPSLWLVLREDCGETRAGVRHNGRGSN